MSLPRERSTACHSNFASTASPRPTATACRHCRTSASSSRGDVRLLGPVGAGESTLTRILATLQEPDEGEVRLGDLDVVRQKDAVRETLGYLPQDFGLYQNIAVNGPSWPLSTRRLRTATS